MKKVVFICLVLLFTNTLIAGLILTTTDRTPDWQSALDAYLGYTDLPAQALFEQHARYPENFNEAFSFDSVSERQIFHTSLPPPEGDISAINALAIQDPAGEDRLTPLPFPPEVTWCLQVSEPPGMPFADLHNDLYNADWVIHTGDSSCLPVIQATLSCQQIP